MGFHQDLWRFLLDVGELDFEKSSLVEVKYEIRYLHVACMFECLFFFRDQQKLGGPYRDSDYRLVPNMVEDQEILIQKVKLRALP